MHQNVDFLITKVDVPFPRSRSSGPKGRPFRLECQLSIVDTRLSSPAITLSAEHLLSDSENQLFATGN